MKKQCTFNWFGTTWRCIRESRGEDDIFGGELDPSEKVIRINEKYDDESFLDYLHHELMEGALFHQACCYTRFFPDRKDMFVMDHSQMDLISGSVRGAYEMIKERMGVMLKQSRRKTTSRKQSNVKTKKGK